MTGHRVGSRRASAPSDRPFYARLLGLRQLRPGGLLCFLLFEGMIVLGALLGLAELASWWAVLLLPVTVAAMVKINDVVAGALARRGGRASGPGRAPVRSAHRARP